jgi:hydrogenase expression/formation protein HypC
MCYAIPAKILQIEEDTALVDYGGILKKINICLIQPVKVNDYVLIHAGFAIEKLEKHSAKESLTIIRNYIAESEKNISRRS